MIDVTRFQFVMVEAIVRLNTEESKGTSLLKALERWKNSSLFLGLHMSLRVE